MRIELPALIAVACLAARVAHARPNATQPTGTRPDAVLRLWPGDAPATQPFDAGDRVERRPNGEVWVSRVDTPTLAVYLPKTAATTATTMPATMATAPTAAAIVCPGGGYAFESYTNEGTRVAERLAESGIAAFVLKYRLPDGHAPAAGTLPVPQQDVLRAIQLVRQNAAAYGVDPRRIGVIGFSAGGHLAATAATLFDQAGTLAGKAGHDAASQQSARPDFAVLIYPVITMTAVNTHTGSRKNLVGTNPADADVARFSAEQHVTPATPPLFVLHAEDDPVVPVANALLITDAASKAGVPCELALLRHGGHGFGLGDPKADTGRWFDVFLAWLGRQRPAAAE